MNVPVRRSIFNRKPESNLYRMFFWIVLILGGIWLIKQVDSGDVKPLFAATPTPTRTVQSYQLEGDAQFTAGQLSAAIDAYREAVRVDPNDASIWVKLARIQTYSTRLIVTDDAVRTRLAEALESADKAVELAPDDSNAHAVRAFVLDWNANKDLWCTQAELLDKGSCDTVDRYLTDADREATQAVHLDQTNTLALAYYAEILADQQKWTAAQDYINQALAREDGPKLMDVHRVNAYILESLGEYTQAIESYDRAIEITPNLTFLYLQAGANYRTLGLRSPNEDTQKQLWEKSLEYFDKAARINAQLEIKDPVPYLSIARTYSQMGEYFAASRNVQKALEFEPNNPDVYGQLGIVYFKSRNYEGSIPALKCAIHGCDEEESCQARYGSSCADAEETGVRITGLALSKNTVVYYYTYGSVLAALSRPQQNYCSEAIQVFNEVKAGFGNDPDIAGIISSGEFICDDLTNSVLTGTPAPAGMRTPSALETSTPFLDLYGTPTPTTGP